MKGLRSWSWGSFLRYPDKEDRKRIEKKEILPRKELNYQTEANTPHEINDLLNDINKLRYAQNQSLPDIRTSYPGTPWVRKIRQTFMVTDFFIIRINSLLIRERILGPKNPATVHYIR